MRPLYNLVIRGGGKLDRGSRWAASWWIQPLPIRPAVDARMYSDARTTDEGLAAVAFFANNKDEFAVSLKGVAEDAKIRGLLATNWI